MMRFPGVLCAMPPARLPSSLSKVIPRKDLPRIYTMYLPPEALGKASGHMAQASSADAAASSLSHALAELSGSVSK